MAEATESRKQTLNTEHRTSNSNYSLVFRSPWISSLVDENNDAINSAWMRPS